MITMLRRGKTTSHMQQKENFHTQRKILDSGLRLKLEPSKFPEMPVTTTPASLPKSYFLESSVDCHP